MADHSIITNLQELKPNHAIKALRQSEKDRDRLETYKIAFLRNITMDNIYRYLRCLCYYEGLYADIHPGEYDQVFQQVLDPAGQWHQIEPDLIVLCLYREDALGELISGFTRLDRKDINRLTERILKMVSDILEGLRRHTRKPILIHNFEVPVGAPLGIYDTQRADMQTGTVRAINHKLIALCQQFKGTYLVDADRIQSKVGQEHHFDRRFWHMARAPYSETAAKNFALEYMKYIRALKGRHKKCLVADCDGTLWGGIIGEDGVEQLSVGPDYPGSVYRDIQRYMVSLYHRGVLLALCSKNNPDDVFNAFDHHPGMVLQREHIVAHRINWQPKAENIESIARELNIGLDSIVFIDDSPYEIEAVRQHLPQVTALQLPPDASAVIEIILQLGLFDTLTWSMEDRARSRMIKADRRREKSQTDGAFTNLDEFHRSLDMEVVIRNADDMSIPRIYQLVQRTNQFNLTTRRYAESEILAMAASENTAIRHLHLSDRFGDLGIVGVAILKLGTDQCVIDTLLLSCRAMGRGVERLLLKDCEQIARQCGYESIIAMYSETPKNEPVSTFYGDNGFDLLDQNSGSQRYRHRLKNGITAPDYFKRVDAGPCSKCRER